MINLEDILGDIENIKVEVDRDITKFSTMKLIARGNLVTVKSYSSLKLVLERFFAEKVQYKVLGLGANQLLGSKEDETYLKIDFPFDKNYFSKPRETYDLPASLTLNFLTEHAINFGLVGWEVFTGIPGTIGGAVFMNAGTNLGEFCELLKSVKVVTKTGEDKTIIVDKNSFSYRKNNIIGDGDVIYEVQMIHHGFSKEIPTKISNYLEMRNRTQPLKKNTCGCVFKNKYGSKTCRAGQYIDIMGLKGFVNNYIKVSSVHANFLENIGNAHYVDVVEMVDLLNKELYLQFGIKFETELQI